MLTWKRPSIAQTLRVNIGAMFRKTMFILLAGAALRQTTPQTPLKVNVDLVNVLFSVTDRNGRFVPRTEAG